MLVIVAWILSAAFASPILHFYNTTETGYYTCRVFFRQMAQRAAEFNKLNRNSKEVSHFSNVKW